MEQRKPTQGIANRMQQGKMTAEHRLQALGLEAEDVLEAICRRLESVRPLYLSSGAHDQPASVPGVS
ncbi:MAG: hypothetical protein ACE5HE_11415 [Phycisphaerae bacterium]